MRDSRPLGALAVSGAPSPSSTIRVCRNSAWRAAALATFYSFRARYFNLSPFCRKYRTNPLSTSLSPSTKIGTPFPPIQTYVQDMAYRTT
ncbi:hypothetical protein BJX65DRAFT_99137 [Aspergillus insuetus]